MGGETLRLRLWQHGIFLLILFLVLAPLAFLILGSFSTARLPGDFSLATMGLVNYLKVYSDPGTYELFTNTVIYVGAARHSGLSWRFLWHGWSSAPICRGKFFSTPGCR